MCVLDQACPECEVIQAGNLAFEEAGGHEERYDDIGKDLEVIRA